MNTLVLRSFVEVAAQGSVSKAAVALGYSQPAISQHLQRVERHVGGRLIERRGGGVALTDLGRRVLPVARIAIFAADELAAIGLSLRVAVPVIELCDEF